MTKLEALRKIQNEEKEALCAFERQRKSLEESIEAREREIAELTGEAPPVPKALPTVSENAGQPDSVAAPPSQSPQSPESAGAHQQEPMNSTKPESRESAPDEQVSSPSSNGAVDNNAST